MIMFERLFHHLSFASLDIIIISTTRVSLLSLTCVYDENVMFCRFYRCIFSNLDAFYAILCSWALPITRSTQSNALGRVKVRQNANAERHTLVYT